MYQHNKMLVSREWLIFCFLSIIIHSVLSAKKTKTNKQQTLSCDAYQNNLLIIGYIESYVLNLSRFSQQDYILSSLNNLKNLHYS